jgi:uncharacterized membrane protein YjgN (DUF898 family)
MSVEKTDLDLAPGDDVDAFIAGLDADPRLFADTQPILTGNKYAKAFKEVIVPLKVDQASQLLPCLQEQALAMISLGLYAPWAQSRVQARAWSGLQFGRQSFEAVLDPLARWRGRLFGLLVLLLMQAGVAIGRQEDLSSNDRMVAAGLVGFAALCVPVLICAFLSGNTRAVRYAGSPFTFNGSVMRGLQTYAWFGAVLADLAWLQALWLRDAGGFALPVFIGVVLVLLGPLVHWQHHRYRINAIQWGSVGLSYESSPLRYYIAWLASLPGIALAALFVRAALHSLLEDNALVAWVHNQMEWLQGLPMAQLWQVLVVAVLMAFAFGPIWLLYRLLVAPLLEAILAPIVLNQITFAAHHIEFRAGTRAVVQEQLLNTAISIGSLGLLARWCQLRWLRFLAAHTSVNMLGQLDLPQAPKKLGEVRYSPPVAW